MADVVFNIKRGATFGPFRATLKNENGTPIDLTGAVITMKIVKIAGGASLVAFDVTNNGAAGSFDYVLTATNSAVLPSGFIGHLDAVVSWLGGQVKRVFTATIQAEDMTS